MKVLFDTIITRNIKDFKEASLPVYEPKEFLGAFELLKQADEQNTVQGIRR